MHMILHRPVWGIWGQRLMGRRDRGFWNEDMKMNPICWTTRKKVCPVQEHSPDLVKAEILHNGQNAKSKNTLETDQLIVTDAGCDKREREREEWDIREWLDRAEKYLGTINQSIINPRKKIKKKWSFFDYSATLTQEWEMKLTPGINFLYKFASLNNYLCMLEVWESGHQGWVMPNCSPTIHSAGIAE